MVTHGHNPRRSRFQRPPTQSTGPADLNLDCAECGHKGVVDNVLVDGATLGEMNDIAQARLVPRGWSVRRNALGGREFVCPTCTRKVADAKINTPLPQFSIRGCCPKCGHGEVAVRYYTGREPDAPLGAPREHLGRKCARCTYAWVEGCLDQQGSDHVNDEHPGPRAAGVDDVGDAGNVRAGSGAEDPIADGGKRAVAD